MNSYSGKISECSMKDRLVGVKKGVHKRVGTRCKGSSWTTVLVKTTALTSFSVSNAQRYLHFFFGKDK